MSRGRVSGGGESVEDRHALICVDYERRIAGLRKSNSELNAELEKHSTDRVNMRAKLSAAAVKEETLDYIVASLGGCSCDTCIADAREELDASVASWVGRFNKCPKHPRYAVKRKPTSDCTFCIDIWEAKQRAA